MSKEPELTPLKASIAYHYYPDDDDFVKWWDSEDAGHSPTQSDFEHWVESQSREDLEEQREHHSLEFLIEKKPYQENK